MPDESPPLPPRRRGRPPLRPNDPSVTFTVRVPATEFDTTYAKARAARVPFTEWLRRRLKRSDRPTS